MDTLTRRASSTDKEKDEDSAGRVVGTYPASIVTAADARFRSTSAEHRRFESFHVNLMAIGGTIGTALFVYMGSGLTSGGPANLLLAFVWWVSVVWAVAEGQKELVTFWPTDACFARSSSRYLDDAVGFAVGWNFWILEIALSIFEVTACGVVLSYWKSAAEINISIIITVIIATYGVLNCWDARYFAHAEFTLALGKILLIIGLLIMTFLTMLGVNPLHDRFGFRFWRDPGPFTGPFPSHPDNTNLFEGFLSCVIVACFTVAGPEYLSLVCGEARNPRKTMPRAFNATIYRLVIFFIGSALAIGILVPFNDPNLLGAQASDAAGAGKSPYVVAMNRLQIPLLPDIVNAGIFTSVLSAGNAYFFSASRSLAQLSADGHAPAFLRKRNRNGVPYISVLVCLALLVLSYCQVSSTSSAFISYLSNIASSGQLVNWIVFSVVWIRWNAALKAQGISRDSLPCRSRFQPFAAHYALVCSVFVTLMQGYQVFLKSNWDTASFVFAYGMPIIFIILSTLWKLLKRTKLETAQSADVTSYIDDPEFTEYIDYAAMDKRGRVGTLVYKVLAALF
ncbi:hypothetical protein JCM8547_008304 [Rhodosporidiobolus lusitaniae]